MLRVASAVHAPPPLPLDVRLTNAVAGVILVLAVLALAAAALAWLARLPAFAIRSVQLEGELGRSSVPTIRANALPRLEGSFFTIDLQRARAAFESVPWVRQAVVRRVFPDRLAVRLVEHRPVALWQGADGVERLVNDRGEVFDANVGDVEDEALPRFAGPDGQSAAMLSMHARLVPVFARADMTIERLELSGRGSWRVELDSGAGVELGRGGEDEVVARTERFVRTLPQVVARFGQPLVEADLRHGDAYAVRLRGVTTAVAAPGAASPPR
ncbi:MAG: cell division protein FtsQ/DivIB [Rubrivivax sp.]|jgi:cell division protein FtsQ|nr:cell division protein FtsQ/DivIB [Rubrivivax sp.]